MPKRMGRSFRRSRNIQPCRGGWQEAPLRCHKRRGRLAMLDWVRALAVAVLMLAAAPAAAQQTALDAYVHKADPAYGWKLVSTIPGAGVTTYVLELTSQTWRSAKDV